jgi:predicted nucleotidyltransferase component of viral defense system
MRKAARQILLAWTKLSLRREPATQDKAMLFDPHKRENLPPLLKAGIAQVMQYRLLDELFSAGAWTAKDIVFQGGTSIHVIWNSPRVSEDLDFMVSETKTGEIGRVVEKAARGIKAAMMRSLPGSDVHVKFPQAGRGSLRDVMNYDVVWSHPKKMGGVRVKVEFFVVEPQHLLNYGREVHEHMPDAMLIKARPELDGFQASDLTVRSLMPVALPESIYGDKLVALAKRRYLKCRDFYDLWWLHSQLGVRPGGAAIYDVARRSADCYAYSDGDLADSLHDFQTHPAEVARDIEQNLAAFLPASVYEALAAPARGQDGNTFDVMYRHAMAETGRLLDAIGACTHAAPELCR